MALVGTNRPGAWLRSAREQHAHAQRTLTRHSSPPSAIPTGADDVLLPSAMLAPAPTLRSEDGMKNKGLAIFLSFIWTGLGQLYAGSILRGLVLMACTPLVWTLGWLFGPGAIYRSMTGSRNPEALGAIGIALTLVPLGFWVWGMIDAKKRCDVHNQQLRSFVLAGTPLAPPAG
jgi:hypothetical protein